MCCAHGSDTECQRSYSGSVPLPKRCAQDIIEVSTEEQREELTKKCAEYEDWMYEAIASRNTVESFVLSSLRSAHFTESEQVTCMRIFLHPGPKKYSGMKHVLRVRHCERPV